MKIQSLNEAWTDIYYLLHYDHKENLTHQNIRCMQTIYKNQNVTVQMLADTMGISHNTASEHSKRLLEKGYVRKYKKEGDRRIVYLELTPEGKEVLKQNTELDTDKLNIILEKLNEGQRSQILQSFELLRQVASDEFRR